MAKKNAAKKRPRKSARLRRAPKPKRGSAPCVDDLHAQVRSLTRQLTEAQERETATSEVLKVISNSPGKLEPVFQAMLANAVRLCAAKFGTLWLRDGGRKRFRGAAGHDLPSALARSREPNQALEFASGTGVGRVVTTKRVVHVHDMSQDPAYLARTPRAVELVELGGARSVMFSPMLKDNEVIGVLTIYRDEVRPFTDKQIELVQNFAAQAVIAIENARLLNELRQRTGDLSESLEQQTATSEVLRVISRSAGDLDPVFQAMLENAVRICDAKFGTMFRFDGKFFHAVANVNSPQPILDFLERRGPFVPADGNALHRVWKSKALLHTPDDAAEPVPSPPTKLADARSHLAVPMLKDDEFIGAIVIYRQEVRPFSNKQIELVSNFAAQAVIAIENARLLGELRQRTDDLSESLEQQTATSEVLKVISSSPGELTSVFEAMLMNAVRICGAKFGITSLREGDAFRVIATHGAPRALEEQRQREPIVRPTPGHNLERMLRTKEPVHVPDILADPKSAPILAKFGGAKALVNVPLLKNGEPIGSMVIFRQEAGPFTDKQIELLKGFAAQAVIAIENARLLSELRQRTDDLSESLEQQTATSEVLKVISSSPGMLEPVFDAMLANATRICKAKFGVLWLCDGPLFRVGAMHGVPKAFADVLTERGPIEAGEGSPLRRVMNAKGPVHAADELSEPRPGIAARYGGARSLVAVPMRRDNELVGAFIIYRQEVRPFTDKQIELVKNFAAQAVIAIENTRLLSELRESLQQQTATSDVLKVISRSTFDLQTVLDTLVASATRLCEADMASINRQAGNHYRQVASFGYSPEFIEFMDRHPIPSGRGSVVGRSVQEGKIVQIEDVRTDPEFAFGAAAKIGGIRTILGVPLLREGMPIGVITLQRKTVRPFTRKQIELVQTFADQAVIAIENVRLFDEVQARTDDLTELLQQQTATADVLKVISRSTFDLKTVLQTLVESAARLTEADMANITRQIDGVFYRSESYGFSAEFMDRVRSMPIKPGRGNVSARALLEGRSVHIPDVLADGEFTFTEAHELGRVRTGLGVPMLREGVPIGVLTLARFEVHPFTDKQIELVTTFADQAAIAIENVRLFDEIQDKSRQLEEASKHKSQFLANMSHELRTPLNAIIGYTELIIDGIYGETPDKALTVLKRVESNGRHLLGLINDVLDFSKMEAGQLKLAIAVYSMKDVVNNVFSAVEPLAAKKNLKFRVDVPPDMPAGHGDERKLTQVLLNLVGNAIKFTDAGEVTIKVAPANGAFSVAVHDTGPGIPKADQDKLFEEFQQADNSITKVKGGTGLGLAIARRIVELHGGRLWVDSSPGSGSVFTFEIPAAVEPARPS